MMPISLNTPSRIQDNLEQMVESMFERGMRRPTRHARTGSYPMTPLPARLIPNHPPPPPPPVVSPGAFAVNVEPEHVPDPAGPGPAQTEEGVTDNPLQNIRAIWRASQFALPFVLILLTKVFYDHRLGKCLYNITLAT